MRIEPLEWFARLRDGSAIRQYDSSGEHSFKEVLLHQDDLEGIGLAPEGGQTRYYVTLKDGHFGIEGKEVVCDLSDKGHTLRPVNFRRWTRVWNLASGDKTSSCEFFMGFQTTIEGKNLIRLLHIVPAGGTFTYEIIDSK